MAVEIATILVLIAGAYALAGIVVGIAFVARGVETLDASARGAGLGFRMVILPAAAGLWPIVLRKWLAARRAARGRP